MNPVLIVQTVESILVKRRLNTTTIWFPMRYWSTACCAWSKAGERKLSNTWRQQSECFRVRPCKPTVTKLSIVL